jgi:methylene-tetrahydromethanopterin dehydrogenase
MERPYILHMFTPKAWMSPFDVNMAADAGYQTIVPYCGIALSDVANLTQDAIFSRGPKGVTRTGLFIGGRDALLAQDMLDAARKAMVPPFVVSTMADPSGAYTTAAALVACVEAQLKRQGGAGLRDQRVVLLGGTGPVGKIAAVLAAQEGAHVRLSSHQGQPRAQQAADELNQRFGTQVVGVSGADDAAVQASLADAEVVMGVAAAGVQVLKAEVRDLSGRLRVAADINAVPPEGVAGVGVMDNGKPLPGPLAGQAVGIGALAIGNVKYQVQHRLLKRMCSEGKAVNLSFPEAFQLAREFLAEQAGAA